MLGFTAQMVQERLGTQHHLVKMYHLLDWGAFAEILSVVYDRKKPVAGVVPYEPIKMFRAMILQAWHSLGDAKMEEALKVRLDFMFFTDFDVAESVPDETSICRFRNRLVAKGLDAKLFTELNRQLVAQGIMVEKAHAAVIDASVIESAAKPRQTVENIAEDRKEDDAQVSEQVTHSVDPDAAWLKKGRKSYYGFKLFAATDEDGFMRHAQMTPANHSEMTYFEPFVNNMPSNEGMRVYSDKGNASKANREVLKKHKLKDGIMHRAARNKPLTSKQKKKNKLISKVRYVVEQSFGTMKRILHFSRSSYMGLDKTLAQTLRKLMCLNMIKAANKVTFFPDKMMPSKEAIQLGDAA